MDLGQSKALLYSCLFFLAISMVSHYNTGSNYTATCARIFAVLEYNETRLEQVLGKDLSDKCSERRK
jgi:hypothetical protein